ncbi:hypothetical protein ACQP00_24450 [Dactylosporangium sp. CS-047395]|uniref:hypothetical protein n=1 Tax=Dactylosporangium sp. CS-047395 TaxID=3239936 RepID=UPI003D8AC5B7
MSAEQVLHTSTGTDGRVRTLTVSIHDGPSRLVFLEKYAGDGPGWLGRYASFRAEARLDTDPGPIVAAVADLANRGRLELPPMAARDRVAELLAAAGLPVRRSSSVPWVPLAAGVHLVVTPDGRAPQIAVTVYQPGETKRHIVVEYDALERITAHLAGPSGAKDDRIGRFVAAFTEATGGQIERIMGLYRALGIEFEERIEHRYQLLSTFRAGAGCTFSLTLLVSAIDDKIAFREFYDYHARAGDPGREYAYSVETPFASLEALTVHLRALLEIEPGGAPADRLAACFQALVERGVLGDGQGIEANRNAVAQLFGAAGVPGKTDVWAWFNE